MRPLLETAQTTACGLVVRSWTEPGALGVPMQDAVHVSVPRPGVLRVAAIDGCTPMRQTPTVAGMNGGTYAALLAAGALGEHGSVPDVLEQVNAQLYRLGPELVAAARPSATCAVAELEVRAGQITVRAWAAGDAQVWVRSETGWVMLVGGSSCAAETRAAWVPQLAALKAAGASIDELQQREAAFYDDETLFVHHTPLGRFEQLRLQQRDAVGFAVVCATDGALLDAAALVDLDGWLGRVRDVEAQGVTRIKATDDLAVVSVAIDTVS